MAKKAKNTKKNRKQHAAAESMEKKPLKIPFASEHPNWTAAVILLALLLIFFNQVMFSDKVFLPPDTVNSQTSQTFVKDALSEGTYPLWNPYIFGGMPSFASLSNAPYVDVTGTIVYGVISLAGKVIPFTGFIRLFANYALLGLMMFLLMRGKGIRASTALFAAAALVFLPQAVAYSVFGHSTKLASFVFLPLIFLLAERLLEKKNLVFFSLLGLSVGLQLLRAHVQICYYTYLMIGVYLIYWAVLTFRHEKKAGPILQGIGLMAGAVAAGVLLSSVLNLSVLEYAKYSIRGGGSTGGLDYGYATNWSFPPAELITFIVPSFMGFGGETYWGSMPFTDFPIYFGLIPLYLAGVSLVVKRNRMTVFFAILAGLALLASFGKYFPVLYGPMFKLLPFFDKFRAPKMINILIGFSLVVMAAYGIEGLLEAAGKNVQDTLKKLKKYSLWFGGIVLFVLLFLLAGRGIYLNWASQLGNKAYKAYDLAAGDALRAMFLFAGAFGLSVLAVKRPAYRNLVPFGFILLLCVDVWPAGRRFMHPQPSGQKLAYFMESPEAAYLSQQEQPFRILPIGVQRSPNWYMYHRLQSVSGYSAVKMRLYQNYISEMLWPNSDFPRMYLKISPENPQRQVTRSPAEVTPAMRARHDAFMKMMNIKYLVSPYNLNSLDSTLVPVYLPAQTGTPGVFEYTDALPRAFLPDSLLLIEEDRVVLDYITSGLLDPERTAIIQEEPEFDIVPHPENRVEVTDFTIHSITVKAELKTPSLLVVSEMYYPAGWNAYVNGVKKKIYRTDYLLRSVFLEPGEHTVEFRFEPRMFSLGLTISLVTLGLLLAGIAAGWLRYRKKREPDA